METQNPSPYSEANARRDPIHPPLSGKTVTVVGLGGAAEIALDLLKSGVTDFRLFDFDVLEIGNLVRHACGKKFVGTNKAEATKRLLEEYCGHPLPGAVAVPCDVFSPESGFENAVRESDIVIVGTDTDASRAYCNDVAVETGTPAVYASMFEKGCGGEVFVHRPGRCCYGCLMLHQERHEFLEKYQKTAHKPDCSSTRDARSMPGIGIDQRFLSSIASRVVLDALLEGENHDLPAIGSNWIVFSVSGIPEILETPLSSLRFDMEPHPGCRCRR